MLTEAGLPFAPGDGAAYSFKNEFNDGLELTLDGLQLQLDGKAAH